MGLIAKVKALGSIDSKSIRRDPLLVWLSVFTLVLDLSIRWVVPWATQLLLRHHDFDLIEYYPLLLGFISLATPGMVGAIIGFLVLDQRDDGTLLALRVTPLTLRGYLVYRAGAPILASFLLTAIALPLSGLMTAGWGAVLLAALIGSPLGPVFALLTACIAANKVQGFAVMKGSSVLAWPVIIAWFVPMPWQVALGVVPHYWIAKAVWVMEAGGNPWPFAAVAVLFQAMLLRLLLRWLERIEGRR